MRGKTRARALPAPESAKPAPEGTSASQTKPPVPGWWHPTSFARGLYFSTQISSTGLEGRLSSPYQVHLPSATSNRCRNFPFRCALGWNNTPSLWGRVFRSLVHQHRTHPAPLGPEPPSPPGFTLAGGRRQPPAPGGAASRRLRRAGLRGTAWGGKWGRLPGSPGRPPQREPPRGSQRRPPPSSAGGRRPAEPGSGSPWRGRAGTPRQRPARGLWWAEVPAGGWGGTHKMEPESPGGRRRVSRSPPAPRRLTARPGGAQAERWLLFPLRLERPSIF